MLCFLHVRRRELQSVRQLHLITRSRLSGAGASAVCSGTKSTGNVHCKIRNTCLHHSLKLPACATRQSDDSATKK